MVPFSCLRKLVPHKVKLLAGVTVHKARVTTQVSSLLPFIARHFMQHTAFAVYHFIVRDRQHKVFVKRVNHAEGNIAMVIVAIGGVFSDVV